MLIQYSPIYNFFQEVNERINKLVIICPFYSFKFFTIILFKGFKRHFTKKLTITRVSKAVRTVPSLVPTTFPSKMISESASEMTTQQTSKPIFIFPNFLREMSATALTNASPELIITFAITESDTPKPRNYTFSLSLCQ